MEQFKRECYEAYTNSDLTEGRGRDVSIGYFTYEYDALTASYGKGVMGTDAVVRKTNIDIQVFDSYDEYEASKVDDAKLRAWRKLTPEERKLLGLE